MVNKNYLTDEPYQMPKISRKKTADNLVHPTAAKSDNLHEIAFDNSVQASLITTTAHKGNIIKANKAACKLLGYSKKELLTKHRKDIWDIKERGFKKMLKERNAEGKSKALVTAFTKSGKAISCEITSAVFMNESGVENAITTITDMRPSILAQKELDDKKEKIVDENILLAQEKSDAALVENNEWIKYIAETSYDVMWDWDVVTGEIYVGDSAEEVFGYKVKNNRIIFSDFTDRLLPEEKDIVEKRLLKTLGSEKKSWNDSFMFKRQDGSIASAISRACVVRDEDGKAKRLIGAIQDVSRLQELEKKLEDQIAIHKEDTEKFSLIAKLTFDVIWDWNLTTNEIFIGDGFEELFGYKIKNNRGNVTSDWFDHLHPDYKEAVEKGLGTRSHPPQINGNTGTGL